MNIKECIDIVDSIKPNQYTIKEKVMWLSFIDEIIINEVLKTHEGYDGRYDVFEGYSEDKLSVPLIVQSPYDRLYTAYLKMKIDIENGETARYNNSAALYNTYMMEYRRHYNKTHMPLNATDNRAMMPSRKNTIGLSDAEYESLKRDVIAALDDIVYTNTSPDKIYDIVMKYVSNNVEMLRGKPGYTPQRGLDYWTGEDVAEINKHIDSENQIIKADILGLNERMERESHFRGYKATNEGIQTIIATPNDFAYSAESGTKWVYDEGEGWIDTTTPVPDQLTPASDSTPLIDGKATPGQANEYARGDHRHPTDTTRLSVQEFNEFKNDVKPFVVTFSNSYPDENGALHPFSVDKTPSEIVKAINDGKKVYGICIIDRNARAYSSSYSTREVKVTDPWTQETSIHTNIFFTFTIGLRVICWSTAFEMTMDDWAYHEMVGVEQNYVDSAIQSAIYNSWGDAV